MYACIIDSSFPPPLVTSERSLLRGDKLRTDQSDHRGAHDEHRGAVAAPLQQSVRSRCKSVPSPKSEETRNPYTLASKDSDATPMAPGSLAASKHSEHCWRIMRAVTDGTCVQTNIVYPLHKNLPRFRRPAQCGEGQSGNRHTCQSHTAKNNTKWAMPGIITVLTLPPDYHDNAA